MGLVRIVDAFDGGFSGAPHTFAVASQAQPLGLPLKPLVKLLHTKAAFQNCTGHEWHWAAFGEAPHDGVQFDLAHTLQRGLGVSAHPNANPLFKRPAGTGLGPP